MRSFARTAEQVCLRCFTWRHRGRHRGRPVRCLGELSLITRRPLETILSWICRHTPALLCTYSRDFRGCLNCSRIRSCRSGPIAKAVRSVSCARRFRRCLGFRTRIGEKGFCLPWLYLILPQEEVATSVLGLLTCVDFSRPDLLVGRKPKEKGRNTHTIAHDFCHRS